MNLEETKAYNEKLKQLNATCVHQNIQISRAGYNYIGHFGQGRLEISFHCGGIYIKNPFYLNELFQVFNIDAEDGRYLDELNGKYCVLLTDKNQKIRALKHLTRDIYWTDGGELLKD